MSRKVKHLAALSLTLLSCSSPMVQGDLKHVSQEFTAPQIAQMQSAADMWCAACGTCFQFTPAAPGDYVTIHFGGRPGEFGRAGGGHVFLDEDIDAQPGRLRNVMAHEIGHLIAPERPHAEPGHVMSARYVGASALTYVDVEWCAGE